MSNRNLRAWPLASDAWRLGNRLNLRHVDRAVKTFGFGRVPDDMMARVYSLGLPPEIVRQTLASIKSLDSWSSEWVETAQHYLGLSRREISAGNRLEAERARHNAAMSYHIAQSMEIRSTVTRDRCRSWASRLAALALPVVNPNARHIMVPWRDRELPALIEAPEHGDGPFGLVILLNGLSMSKEETFRWSPRFLQAGYAVVALDSPGTGEATSLGPVDASYNDILNGVFQVFEQEPAVDLERVFVIGASLGGNEAIRFAARDKRILGAVAVTPAVSPGRWMNHANPLLSAEMDGVLKPDGREPVAGSYDVLPLLDRLRQPVLVFGAGRDMVVPPNESQILAAELGEQATLVWYPDLGHCLYAAIDQWTAQAAAWISAMGEGSAEGATDAATLAAIGQAALEHLTIEPLAGPTDEWDEEFEEYARVIPVSERED